jgi:calcium-dependent protein kinase
LIGSGTYGLVNRVKMVGSGQQRAVKIIPKDKIKHPKRLVNEINILKTLDHPNIIKLFETFEDARNIYLVME